MKIIFRDALKVVMWLLLIRVVAGVDFERAIRLGDLVVFVVFPLTASAILDFLFTYPTEEDDK